jgi:hypothetical protein
VKKACYLNLWGGRKNFYKIAAPHRRFIKDAANARVVNKMLISYVDNILEVRREFDTYQRYQQIVDNLRG